jgi:hypothetical protein
MEKHQTNLFQSSQTELTLLDIFLFARRRWLAIVTPAVICAVLTGIFISSKPILYQSTVSIDLPSEVDVDTKKVLPFPHSYQIILESLETKDELSRRLQTKAVSDSKYTLHSRLNTATTPPTLEAIAETATPVSSVVLEEWLKLFQERLAGLIADAQEGARRSKAIKASRQMAILKQRESEIEKDCAKSLEEIVQRFEKKDIDVRHQCDDMIVAEDQTASGKVAAHVAETEKLLREPDFKDSLTAMKLQADALQKTYSALQEEQAKSTYQLTQPSAEGRLQQISLLVDSCAEKLQSVERRINEAQLKRDALVRERADGLQKIRDESAIRKAKINDQREVQSASFGKQRDDLIKSLLQSKSDRLNGVFGSMISLQRDIDSNEAEASTDRPTQVRVLVAPIGPSQPAALGLGKYMIVALFGGLVAGFLFAFILELMTSANWINSNTYIERAN